MIVVVLVCCALLIISVYINWDKIKSTVIQGTDTISDLAPIRTDFETGTPADFYKDIPLEKNISLRESYTLNYGVDLGKQSTIVFESSNTVEQNYELYKEFFNKNQWALYTDQYNEKISSLYALKDGVELSITVVAGEEDKKTQVSVSALQK